LESILPAYNDPLFSILLIIVMALIIALMTYAWGLYKEQKEEGKLLKFLEKFDSSECALDTGSMPFEVHMIKPLTLLARAFENSGEYHKSINIYLYLIKHTKQETGELELMERLGNTYLHAGFLERSRSIYLEILRRKPRNIAVLYDIGIVYEMMQEYSKAKEILVPLKILGEKTDTLEAFFDFAQLIESKNISMEVKVIEIKAILAREPKMYRQIVSALLKLNLASAWEIIDPSRTKELIDILWFLSNSQLDLAIISSSDTLQTLYYAKGYLQTPKTQSTVFSLDMLAMARQGGLEGGDLLFSYLCQKCKQSFPVSFTRCPSCTAINSVKVEEKVVKSSPSTNYSLL
jgi:lipopolysaccharide biosynthesis regulator YciM